MASELGLSSPDGRIHVWFESVEAKMSHWIDSPIIRRGGVVVLDLTEPYGWDGSAKFLDDGVSLELCLRKYPGNKPGFTVVVNADAETVTFEGESELAIPAALFIEELEQRHSQQAPWFP